MSPKAETICQMEDSTSLELTVRITLCILFFYNLQCSKHFFVRSDGLDGQCLATDCDFCVV